MTYINHCTDTTPPVDDRPFFFPHSIYFAKYTDLWKGAKAFLDDTTEGNTFGRIYKVTREQYEQIKAREGSDYSKKLKLGIIEGLPVYSFTDTQKNIEVKMPSEDYYNEILKGLKECYIGILDNKEIVEYLNSTVMSETEFIVVKEIKNNSHYLSIQAAHERTGLALEQVKTAIQWLVNHQVIQQDTRSINAGHQITDADAFFYTVESKTGRNLVKAMVDACSAGESSSILENDNVSVDGSVPEDEGGRRNVVATRIERSHKNRTMAISLHGCKCQVCGFDFENFYGELGKGYIEVHHVNPLANQNGAHVVSPETDLVCLCSNCHRMIHKNGSDVLSVEELKLRLQR
jgi:predicted HNH restriction endonuclease